MKPVRLNLLLFSLLILLALLSLAAGRIWIMPRDLIDGSFNSLILVELRIPRVVLGIITGAALGMAGAVMQGFLRNPLADPGIFGVSSSAALGAVCSLYLGLGAALWMLPAFALVGAAAGMGLLALLAGRSGSVLLFTLAGLLLSSLTGSLTSLLISLAPSPYATAEIVTWLMGALTDRSWQDVQLAGPLVLVGLGLLMATRRHLDALTLGDSVARSLGLDMRRLQWLVIGGVGLTIGASVAVAGIIGFVGLIVPHLVRPLVGHKPSALLVPSALAGAVLLVGADSLVRLLPTVSELRLGIVMALLGAPFFLMLLFRMRRELA